MLNEICDAIEAMSSEKTLVFVFEDLHWADLSTLDLISALARRRQAARLFLLASFRPAEVSSGQHPLKRLKQDLVTHKLCADVPLRPLERDAVREYLVQELKQETLPKGLPSFVHQHSEGNPLFMVSLVEDLVARGLELSHHFKTDGHKGKLVLRGLAARWLPEQVASHPKQGFSIPLDILVTDRFHSMLQDYLLSPASRIRLLINTKLTERWLEMFKTSKHRPRAGTISREGLYQRIFILLALELWLRRHKLSW